MFIHYIVSTLSPVGSRAVLHDEGGGFVWFAITNYVNLNIESWSYSFRYYPANCLLPIFIMFVVKHPVKAAADFIVVSVGLVSIMVPLHSAPHTMLDDGIWETIIGENLPDAVLFQVLYNTV